MLADRSTKAADVWRASVLRNMSAWMPFPGHNPQPGREMFFSWYGVNFYVSVRFSAVCAEQTSGSVWLRFRVSEHVCPDAISQT